MNDPSGDPPVAGTPGEDPAIYDELRRIALRMMGSERRGHTLQPTALVHEAWLRAAGPDGQRADLYRDRRHFLSTVTTIMRRVLVDHARARATLRRGGERLRLATDEMEEPGTDGRDLDLLALDEALSGLAALDERQARIVEFRFFGGLALDDIAVEMNLSERTVDREWACAKAWLYREMEGRGTRNEEA